ncbi:MAG: Isoaspartyl peptidase precursor [Planctomycetota bacterium]|jgi:hypothetical protein
MSHLPLAAVICSSLMAVLPGVSAGDFPAPEGMRLVYGHDFEDQQTARYQPTDESAWKLINQNGNHVLALTKRNSNFSPPFRSPLNRTLIRDVELSSFVMDVRFQSTIPDYGHRDLCLFFGWQDDAHLYYVHFGKQADEHANQIFIVNSAARKKISLTSTTGTPWTDNWHQARIRRNAESGEITVWFDSLEKPVMTAKDTTFSKGRVGFGSFDDIGNFDAIRIYAPAN